MGDEHFGPAPVSTTKGGLDTTVTDTQPSILSYLKDIPNLCSLAGLACTVSAIYFCIADEFHAAMIGMIWAVVFDWADGLVARRMPQRTGKDREFGGQLDVLIDIVSYGVTPAILLITYGQLELIYLAGAFVMLAASALRLSYFSIYGLADGKKYVGLALDNNSLVLVFVFAFEGILSQEAFSVVLLICGLALATLNVSSIKTPKLSGNPACVIGLGLYALGLSALHGSAFF